MASQRFATEEELKSLDKNKEPVLK
jgi:hypothetical protein